MSRPNNAVQQQQPFNLHSTALQFEFRFFLFEQCFDFKIVCEPLEMKLSRKALENKWIYLMKVNKCVYKRNEYAIEIVDILVARETIPFRGVWGVYGVRHGNSFVQRRFGNPFFGLLKDQSSIILPFEKATSKFVHKFTWAFG